MGEREEESIPWSRGVTEWPLMGSPRPTPRGRVCGGEGGT